MSAIKIDEFKFLKAKIKKWESEFLKINSKKPTQEDVHNSPSDVKEAYRNYWKLKNSVTLPQDDVWGEILNKSNKKDWISNKSSCNVKSYCEKIRKKSNFEFIQKDVNVPENQRTQVLTQSTSITNNGNELNDSDDLKIDLCKTSIPGIPLHGTENVLNNEKNHFPVLPIKKTPAKFIKTFNFSTAKNINMFSPTINLSNPVKTLHYKQNINEDWLKRCEETSSQLLELEYNNKVIEVSNEVFNSDFAIKDAFVTSSHENVRPSNTTCSQKKLVKSEDNFKGKVKDEYEKGECCKNARINNETEVSIQSTDQEENDLGTLNHNNSPDKILLSGIINQGCTSVGKKKVIGPDDEINRLKDPPVKVIKRKLTSTACFRESSISKKVNNLKRKMAAGTLNDNYVQLNIKKKKFSRGYRQVNIKKLKWNKWKQLKKSSGTSTSNVTGCFKCGEFGHWAKQCTAPSNKKENEACLEEEDPFDIPLPTLEEAAKIAQETKLPTFYGSSRKTAVHEVLENHSITAQSKSSLKEFNETFSYGCLTPLYETTVDGTPIETPKAVFDALHEMGYSNFRTGQETAIMRVISGLSTLVVLPTGSGKSLCYQLPAYMYSKHNRSFAIIVSPLVSLMEDQVTGLPPCLHAVCIHSGMTEIQKAQSMKGITEGLVQILLVSPETITGSHLFIERILNSDVPAISFACIDEVHCISQWSHNFRPSYLQLYKVLTQKMGIKCILGLTATATKSTIEDIISHLNLKYENECVVGSTNVPDNLHISVSRDKDKDKALLQLLCADRFRNCSSIIIYCIRRLETERLAAFLRTSLQEEEMPEKHRFKTKRRTKKRCFAWTIEAYHAGLAPPMRKSIQKKFMTGKLRVIIATVAFGMGLDKPDIYGIIHYNMPKTFENYVQEIGRAGRDGLDSHCHLFLDTEGNDIWEQQKHIYANSIDRHTVRKLLKKVFPLCKCQQQIKSSSNDSSLGGHAETDSNMKEHGKCTEHEVAFPINEIVQELDVKEENISTLLCYLELHPKHWIEVLRPVYSVCTVRCYGGPKQLRSVALKSPIVAAALALTTENEGKMEKVSSFSFPIIQIASAIKWNSSAVKQHLKSLEWNENKRKTGVIVEFSDLAFHVRSSGNLSDEELDEVLDFLYNKVLTTEETELRNLNLLFSVFKRFSFSHYWDCCDEVDKVRSEGIKESVNKYFTGNNLLIEELKDDSDYLHSKSNEVDFCYVRNLIKEMICTHHDQDFTGRSIARIFHGIGSPCFPPEIWGKVHKYWRCLLSVNFNTVLKMANEELRNFK